MKKSVRLACIVLFLVLFSVCAFAQAGMKDFPAGKWWARKAIIKELNLSTEQQAKIEACWTQRNQVLMGQQAELRKRQQELTDLAAKDYIDETAAMRLFDEVQRLRASLERNTFLMRIQIKNTLTPEQQRRTEEIAERLRQQQTKQNAAPQAPLIDPVKKKAGRQADCRF
jgi:Spy/CpxP family protein refolding chaperone